MRIRGKRIKWEPGALFAFVLILGVWLALGPDAFRKWPKHEGAVLFDVRIADSRGKLEAWEDPASHQQHFRVLLRDGYISQEMTADQLKQLYGPQVFAQASAKPNRLFQLLNITSWASLIWVAVGFGGQLAFSGRMIIQWWVSEKRRESHVPMAFWLWSLVGSVMLFSYFIWRQDPVGVLGQCTGLVVYARNLRLIQKSRRRAARAETDAEPADSLSDPELDDDEFTAAAPAIPDQGLPKIRQDTSQRHSKPAVGVQLASAGEPTDELRNP